MAEIVAKCPLCGEEIEYLIKREQALAILNPEGPQPKGDGE